MRNIVSLTNTIIKNASENLNIKYKISVGVIEMTALRMRKTEALYGRYQTFRFVYRPPRHTRQQFYLVYVHFYVGILFCDYFVVTGYM